MNGDSVIYRRDSLLLGALLVAASLALALLPVAWLVVAIPGLIVGAVILIRPHVAIFSHAAGGVKDRVPVWVELYPEHASRSVLSEGGKHTEFAEIQLQDLLAIVDRAAGAN